MRKVAPLIFVECYLLATLAAYFFGPLSFNSHNLASFLLLIAVCHASFIFGYMLALKTYSFNGYRAQPKFSAVTFYSVLALAVFGVLLSYKNLMLSPSLIPIDIFAEVKRGLEEPGLVYAERMAAMNSSQAPAGRVINILSFFFAFFKLLFIFLFMYYWSDLGFINKMLSVIYCFFFAAPGLASGTNSVIFLLFIFLLFSLVSILYIKNHKHLYKVLALSFLLFLIPIGLFGFFMSRRGGGFGYFAKSSPLGDISVSAHTPTLDGVLGFYYYSLVWLDYYIVQGYYGLSLILDMDLKWTYGFGSSAFLQRQFLMLSGIDVSADTFQSRVSHLWDAAAQWHSFYGQVANDVGFYGLSLVMFILGGLLSRVWLSVIYKNSFYGSALIPVFVLMFIFFPANNQVFGYIDTFSYFVFMMLFWCFEGKRVRLR